MVATGKRRNLQEPIYAYIVEHIKTRSMAPTIREIQDALEISSTSVVSYNLNKLRDDGKIEYDKKKARSIRVVDESAIADVSSIVPLSGDSLQVPYLGVITAGSPLPDPEEGSSETVTVPADTVPAGKLDNVYALRVRGQSMIDALIDDGDLVLLRYQPTAQNGDMVAARIIDENAVTLKKFYHEGDRVRLQPANSTMDPIYVAASNVEVQGRVISVLRTLAN